MCVEMLIVAPINITLHLLPSGKSSWNQTEVTLWEDPGALSVSWYPSGLEVHLVTFFFPTTFPLQFFFKKTKSQRGSEIRWLKISHRNETCNICSALMYFSWIPRIIFFCVVFSNNSLPSKFCLQESLTLVKALFKDAQKSRFLVTKEICVFMVICTKGIGVDL